MQLILLIMVIMEVINIKKIIIKLINKISTIFRIIYLRINLNLQEINPSLEVIVTMIEKFMQIVLFNLQIILIPQISLIKII